MVVWLIILKVCDYFSVMFVDEEVCIIGVYVGSDIGGGFGFMKDWVYLFLLFVLL